MLFTIRANALIMSYASVRGGGAGGGGRGRGKKRKETAKDETAGLLQGFDDDDDFLESQQSNGGTKKPKAKQAGSSAAVGNGRRYRADNVQVKAEPLPSPAKPPMSLHRPRYDAKKKVGTGRKNGGSGRVEEKEESKVDAGSSRGEVRVVPEGGEVEGRREVPREEEHLRGAEADIEELEDVGVETQVFRRP